MGHRIGDGVARQTVLDGAKHRRIVVKGQRQGARRRAAVRIACPIDQRDRACVIFIAACCMKHIVEQSYCVGAGLDVSDLHREQRRPGTCATFDDCGQRIGRHRPAIANRLAADGGGQALHARKAQRAYTIGPVIDAKRTAYHRLIASPGMIADPAGVAARQAFIIERRRNRRCGRGIVSPDRDGQHRIRWIAIAVDDRIAKAFDKASRRADGGAIPPGAGREIELEQTARHGGDADRMAGDCTTGRA